MRCVPIVYRTRSEVASFFEEFMNVEPVKWVDGEEWSVSVGVDKSGETYAIVVANCKGYRVAVGKVRNLNDFLAEIERLTENYIDPCKVFNRLEKYIISG